jgi:ABC-2 type transport system permease protein
MPDERRRRLRDLLTSARDFFGEGDRGGSAGTGPGFTLPYTVRTEAVTAGPGVAYNGYAHAFAGMGVQFLLFATANLGIEMLLERQRGLWKRFRSAPVSRYALLAGKVASGTIIALMTLLVSFGFAMIVFRVRVAGSVLGFLSVAVACSLMAATFGVLVAALGRTPATARGVTTLAVLLMVMLGGAWVPTFVFPAWLQRLTVVVPARWAVDGLDAMTWRGLAFSAAIVPTLVLLAFAALFASVALARFRWEEG